MAVSAFTSFSNGMLNISKGQINLASDAIVMALVTGTYVPAVDTHSTWANVSANEVATGGGYTQGGVQLTAQSATLTGATVTFTSATASWASATFTCRYAVLVKRAGGSLASTDLLIGYVDLSGGGNVVAQGGTFSVSPSASGWFTMTHSP